MKVAILSKADARNSGASRVAVDLTALLNTVDGVTAHHWRGYLTGPPLPHERSLFGGRVAARLHRACRVLSRRLGLPDLLTPELAPFLLGGGLSYDLCHFFDLSTAISPLTLSWISRRRPTVWTFQDFSPFTGGCVYPGACTAFHERCGACPRLHDWPLLTRIDRTGFLQGVKRSLAARGAYVPLVPSRWLAGEAMKSGFFRDPPRVVPNVIDEMVFRPEVKAVARRALGLPADRFIVLVSALDLRNRQKGTDAALAALQAFGRPHGVLVVGRSDAATDGLFGASLLRSTGLIMDRPQLARHYAAADVFLFPTKAETFGIAVAEAMACGTPPVAFGAGALPELVDHGSDGWLAPPGDVAGLVEGLRFSHDERAVLAAWSAAGSAKARRLWARAPFLSRHLEIYREILGDRLPAVSGGDEAAAPGLRPSSRRSAKKDAQSSRSSAPAPAHRQAPSSPIATSR